MLTMKKIYNKYTFIMALFLSLGIMACEDEQDGFPKLDQSYVAFSSDAANISESQTVVAADGQPITAGSTYTVELIRSSTDLSSPLTITIVVNGVFVDSTDFSLPGDDASSTFNISEDVAAVTIPAGKVSAQFLIAAKNDLEPSGNKQIALSIQSVSDPSYQIGIGAGENKRNKQLNLTVVDDDCPIDLISFEGDYEVTNFVGAPGASYDGLVLDYLGLVGSTVTLAADPSDPLGTTAILSGGLHAEKDLVLKFNTCENAVYIDSRYPLEPGGFEIQPTNEPGKYGTGAYNEDSKKISLVVGLTNPNNTDYDEFIIEYQKK